ncbi:MAG TPA: TIR domain-containing protein [Candidatus Limnocylindrales bacterium]
MLVTTPPIAEFDYDVALSFAGEDRSYVERVAELLRDRGVRLFYDQYMTAELWGNDLYAVLDEVYRRRARFTIAFISASYVSKPWTRHERQSAQARTLIDDNPYLLPVRLDDSELPGLRPTVAYVDARLIPVEKLVELVEQKLRNAPGHTVKQLPVLRSPRTKSQERELLAQRPSGWEYLLYAGVLWQRREAIELKWRDHELGYGARLGQHMDDGQAMKYLGRSTNDFQACASNMMKMIGPAVQERAFGRPGEPGNPELIDHVATRLVNQYEAILDIAASLRGVGVSAEAAPVMEAAARLTDEPLNQFRAFVDHVIAQADSIPELLNKGGDQPINLTAELTLTVNAQAQHRFQVELEKLRAFHGI